MDKKFFKKQIEILRELLSLQNSQIVILEDRLMVAMEKKNSTIEKIEEYEAKLEALEIKDSP